MLLLLLLLLLVTRLPAALSVAFAVARAVARTVARTVAALGLLRVAQRSTRQRVRRAASPRVDGWLRPMLRELWGAWLAERDDAAVGRGAPRQRRNQVAARRA